MSKRQVRVVQSDEAVMYLGPSLPDGLLKQTNHYVGGVLPQYVQDLADKNKDIAYFLVPISKAPPIIKNLKNKSSLDHARFVRILETYKGAK